MLPTMTGIEIADLGYRLSVLANHPIRALVHLLRRPLLLAATVFAFVVCAVASLTLSAVVFDGWWQQFFLDAGVSLLFVGVVDLVILGALRTLLESPAPEGVAPDAPDHGLSEVLAVVQRIDLRQKGLASPHPYRRRPAAAPLEAVVTREWTLAQY